jgi:hypothetical protein
MVNGQVRGAIRDQFSLHHKPKKQSHSHQVGEHLRCHSVSNNTSKTGDSSCQNNSCADRPSSDLAERLRNLPGKFPFTSAKSTEVRLMTSRMIVTGVLRDN